VRLFEIGRAYLPKPGAKLPDEPRRLALALCGFRWPDFWEGKRPPILLRPALDFFDLKGDVEALADGLHLPEVVYSPSAATPLHPGKAANMLAAGAPIGYFGELHPKTAEAFGLAGRVVLVAEFDLDAMQAAVPARRTYTPPPRFPAALRDVAVIVDEATPAERVEAEIRKAGEGLLRGVRLFDLYRGESIGAGVKSLAYALTYQADDRTLTDKEVDRAHKKIQDRLRHVLKARIRGEEA
jgi:phenylalanyl-tRNA synthetase beta chain